MNKEDEKIYISKEELDKFKKLKERYVYFEYGMDARIKNIFEKMKIETALDFFETIATFPISHWRGIGAKSQIILKNYLLQLGIIVEGLNDDTITKEYNNIGELPSMLDIYGTIEEKIEKLHINQTFIIDKINQIIDKINNMEE